MGQAEALTTGQWPAPVAISFFGGQNPCLDPLEVPHGLGRRHFAEAYEPAFSVPSSKDTLMRGRAFPRAETGGEPSHFPA